MGKWTRCLLSVRLLVAALCLPAVLVVGCDDPLSPHEQRQIMDRLLDPDLAWDWDYGSAMGPPIAILLQLPQTEVMVEVDGEWARFNAFALEYAHIPDTGHFGSLSRNRRRLFAWRVDDPSQRFMLSGGGFPGAMGPWALEEDPGEMLGYRPHIMMRGAERQPWQNRRGRASFANLGPGRGSCNIDLYFSTAFASVAADGTVDKSSTGGFRCEEMLYEVGFEAELGKRWQPEEGRLTLRMRPQQVTGIRMTRECDGSQGAVAHLCGASMDRPPPVDSQNPDPPSPR